MIAQTHDKEIFVPCLVECQERLANFQEHCHIHRVFHFLLDAERRARDGVASETPQHCHGKKTVTIFAIMTTQRKQLVACCLSNKLLLCVHSSQLWTQSDFHVSALLCQTTPASTRRHSTPPPTALEGLSTSVPSCAPSASIHTLRRIATPSNSVSHHLPYSNPSSLSINLSFVHPSQASRFCCCSWRGNLANTPLF